VTESFKLWVLENDRSAFEAPLTDPLELGRQRAGEPDPYALLPATDKTPARLIVARQSDSNISRQHLLLQPLLTGLVRVSNRSQLPLPQAESGPTVPPGGTADLVPPFSLLLEGRLVRIVPADSVDEHGVQGLAEQTLAPGSLEELSQRLRPLPALGRLPLDDLVGWLQTTMGVLQSTVGSADFLERATAALVQIVGLDSGRVLLLDGDAWAVAAVHGRQEADWRPSRHVLDRVRQEQRTFWQQPRHGRTAEAASLEGLHTVLAAPILDAGGAVIGALYGERRAGDVGVAPVGKVEALLVELLACGVSTGLARRQQEKAALTAQVQFEQFFGPDLARQLREQPDLLAGRDAEVTLLFADVRGFSRISERLGPARTVAWIGEVMGALSACVLAEEGVLVDYIGDELVAMWGAPRSQPDQASRAVSAALAMRVAVHELDEHWRAELGEPLAVGLGLNTGPAQVGNTGSRYKFKYGPLGNTVNLASRVQGLTKYLKCRLLVTAATRQGLDGRFIARRVCQARVVNIAEPVKLYEVEAAGVAERAEFFRQSEAALNALEAKEFALAARQAGALLQVHTGDGPLLLVLSRAAQMLMQGGPFDPVWEPPGK
jgi:adenylate cyclase